MRLRTWITGFVAVTLAAPAAWWFLTTQYPPRAMAYADSSFDFYLGVWHLSTDNGSFPFGGYIMVLVVSWLTYLMVFLVRVMNDRANRQQAATVTAAKATADAAHQSLMP
jgi:hypothetical protein